MTGSVRPAAIALLLLGSSMACAAEDNGRDKVTGSDTAALASISSSLHARERAVRPAYGPGGWRCPPAFVWRNGGRKDWLCVDALEAQRIARENQRASETWATQSDGGHACRSGLVPREAFQGDIVCVDALRRESIRTMNFALYTDL
jgi:hypothetical protein